MSKRYLVFREYTPKERPDRNERLVFYGWTKQKEMILAFLKQRSPKKYRIRKVNLEDIKKIYGEDLNMDMELDFAELKSVKTKEKIYLITTKLEMNETEKKVSRLFRELSSISSMCSDCVMEVLRLFVNLDEYYAIALFFLGFRPPELDDLFPSADPTDDYSNTQMLEDSIDEEYTMVPWDHGLGNMNPITPWITEDTSKQLIYSFESFIKVLREDM